MVDEDVLGFFLRGLCIDEMTRILYVWDEKIQQHMDLMRTSCFIVLAILLCLSASICSGESKNAEELFIDQLVDPASGKINGEVVRAT